MTGEHEHPAGADGRRGRRTRRRASCHLAPIVLAVAVATGAVACSSGTGGSGGDAAAPTSIETFPPTTVEPAGCDVAPEEVVDTLPPGVDPGAVPTLPSGVDTGYTGSGPGSGNPYLVPGARPVPGPDMPVTTLGPDPLTVVVAVPPNPDVGTPADLPGDATTVPPEPTTLPPIATTVAPTESTTTTTGLMSLADDPGCVGSPGDP